MARLAGLLATAAALACAPAAMADTAHSSNWAGYAVHRAGVAFRSVQGTWTQPHATCVKGRRSYSSYWVGIGGYSLTSEALEQVGTEVDCAGSGKVRSSAWFELVPAPSVQLHMVVQPGDAVTGRVAVDGHKVLISLYDHTLKHGFSRTVTVPKVDASSAEWIVEAPSACFGSGACVTLPLANFGSARFRSAKVRTTAGRVGSISSTAWDSTTISLVASGRRFVTESRLGASTGTATPSALTDGGHSFQVTYASAAPQAPQISNRRRFAVRAILRR